MPGNEIHLKIIDFGSAIKLENGESMKIKKYLITNPQFFQIQLNLIDFKNSNKLENGQLKEIKKKLTTTPQFLAPEIEMANNEEEVLV
jgi:serine/threonine protein kinase